MPWIDPRITGVVRRNAGPILVMMFAWFALDDGPLPGLEKWIAVLSLGVGLDLTIRARINNW